MTADAHNTEAVPESLRTESAAPSKTTTRGWLSVLAASLALAVLSLVSNITTPAQLEGRAEMVKAIRLPFSMIFNSGTAWAGLAVLAGYLVRRWWVAPLAGVAAELIALTAHYLLAQATHQMGADAFSENLMWFVAAFVMGVPLGLIGTLAHRADPLGLLGRLVVPAGALIEPWFLHMFTPWPQLPWPDRFGSIVTGVVLTILGLAGAAHALRRYVRSRAATSST